MYLHHVICCKYCMRGLLLERIEAARKASYAPDEEICLGAVEEFSREELDDPPTKINISRKRVFLIDCPLAPHNTLIMFIGQDLCSDIQSSLAPPFQIKNAFAHGELQAPKGVYYNLFCGVNNGSCGKIPDISLSYRFNMSVHRYSSPTVWEVAFRHETLEVLLEELFNWLSLATDIIYACGVKIFEGKAGLRFRVIVMERSQPTDPDLLECQKFPLKDLRQSMVGAHGLGSIILDAEITQEGLVKGERIDVVFSAEKLNSWYGLRLFQQDVIYDITPALRTLILKADRAKKLGIYPDLV